MAGEEFSGRVLFDDGRHRVVVFHEGEDPHDHQQPIGTNQYLIVSDGDGILLDPGGQESYAGVYACLREHLDPKRLRAVFLSHLDPDVAGSIVYWMNGTPARVLVSGVWTRFVGHFGIRDASRIIAIDDGGASLTLPSGLRLDLLPAHFLHSAGTLNLYDPHSAILFSADIGAALGLSAVDEDITDLAAHQAALTAFHRRYMSGQAACRLWVQRMRQLHIERIAPQHGPCMTGPAVPAFLSWLEALPCGVDLAEAWYQKAAEELPWPVVAP